MWKEFKEFAMRGNVVDMAVGITVGAAFGLIAKSLVDNIIMPPIGLLLGKVDFSQLYILLKEGTTPGPYITMKDATAAGAVIMSYGAFLNTIISFIIIAFAIFLVVKGINKMKKREEKIPAPAPTTKNCPYCLEKISIKASRCPYCTSQIEVNI